MISSRDLLLFLLQETEKGLVIVFLFFPDLPFNPQTHPPHQFSDKLFRSVHPGPAWPP